MKGDQVLSSWSASECPSTNRSYGQDLPGQHDRSWSSPQDVIQMPRTHGRNQGSCTLNARTQDSPGSGLHSQRSKFGRYTIASEGSRHVVLSPVHTTRALTLDTDNPGLTGVYGPSRVQTEHSCPKICNASSLSSSRVRGILIYPYWSLQPWFQGVQKLSPAHYILPPPHLCVQPYHPGIVETFVNREVQLRAVVFDCA